MNEDPQNSKIETHNELLNRLLNSEFNSSQWHKCFDEIRNNALGLNVSKDVEINCGQTPSLTAFNN